MKLYWSLNHLPELEGRDRRVALKIWRMANQDVIKDAKYWFAFLPAGILAAIGSGFMGVAGAAIAGALGALVSLPIAMNVARPHVAKAVERYDREN